MRFLEMTIENFGPYYEKAIVNLDSGKDGVIIFWGNNGRGKTTLLNAFRFALYGEIKKRNNTEVNYYEMINKIGSSEGKNYFTITLKIKDNDDTYELIRRYGLINPEGHYSTKKEDYQFITNLKKNTSILSRLETEKYIANLLPIDISRFFLFDGELLQEYESLLDDGDLAGDKIKTSIEKILGLPYLVNSSNDCGKYFDVIESSKKKAIQADKTVEKFTAQYNSVEEEIKTHQESMRNAKDDLDKLIKEKTTIESKLGETELAREWMTDIKNKEYEIRSNKQSIESLKNQIKSLTKDAWKYQIKSKIDETIADLNNHIDELKEKESLSKINSNVVEMLRDAIAKCQCPLCTQEIEKSLAEMLKTKEKDIESTGCTSLTDEESKMLIDYQSRYKSLSSLKTIDYIQDIKDKETLINEAEVNIVDANSKISTLKEKLADLDFDHDVETSILALPKMYADCETKISNLRTGLAEEDKKVQELIANRNELWRKINQTGNKDLKAITKKSELINDICSIFKEAIDLFRYKLKTNVEKDATELFKKLSAEKDYERLSINDNYGLSIINKDGIEAPNRSAGYEHIVALSLIGALHKNAPLKGPIIMDSPFGRLDPDNKKNVCSVLPYLADQVVLLMYEDEINAQMLRKILDSSLVNEHKLVRVESMKTVIE